MNIDTNMIYPWIHGVRFKPQVNDNLGFLEITDYSGFIVGEPYLIEMQRLDRYNHTIKLKGTFIKIFQGSHMIHILLKNKKGQIFPAPVQESRFYKSPDRVIVGPRLHKVALFVAINYAYGYPRPTGEHDNDNIENTVGYCLGNGWISTSNTKDGRGRPGEP